MARHKAAPAAPAPLRSREQEPTPYLHIEEELRDAGDRDKMASLSDMRRGVICRDRGGRLGSPAGVAVAGWTAVAAGACFAGVADAAGVDASRLGWFSAPSSRLGALTASFSPAGAGTLALAPGGIGGRWLSGAAPVLTLSVCALGVLTFPAHGIALTAAPRRPGRRLSRPAQPAPRRPESQCTGGTHTALITDSFESNQLHTNHHKKKPKN